MSHRNSAIYNFTCGDPNCRRCAQWAFERATEARRRRQEAMLMLACWAVSAVMIWLAYWH